MRVRFVMSARVFRHQTVLQSSSSRIHFDSPRAIHVKRACLSCQPCVRVPSYARADRPVQGESV
eukprot:4007234-Pleurochrysis_carterae.AAC.3